MGKVFDELKAHVEEQAKIIDTGPATTSPSERMQSPNKTMPPRMKNRPRTCGMVMMFPPFTKALSASRKPPTPRMTEIDIGNMPGPMARRLPSGNSQAFQMKKADTKNKKRPAAISSVSR
jgi:hypothetical protein